ncbi:MAG: tol-pal system protein YbgF [Acidobacteria bacterium]|nr:MAG: tol-pal system protein YbgF [Acidobacteriota bacterium]
MKWQCLVFLMVSIPFAGCVKKDSGEFEKTIKLEERVQLLELRLAELSQDLSAQRTAIQEKPPVQEEKSQKQGKPPAEEVAVAEPEDGFAESRERSAYSSAQDHYNEAYRAYKNKELARSDKLFSSFISSYPDHKYQANALYWRGEICYDQKEYEKALACFRQVVEKYPSSPKAPDALLKVGFTLEKQGKNQAARQVYQQVSEKYPYSRSSEKAKRILSGVKI